MTSTSNSSKQLADLLVHIEAEARTATTLTELGFSIANDSYSLLGFRQALVFTGADQKAQLLTVSGLAKPTEDSPYLLWLRRTWSWLFEQLNAELKTATWLQLDQITQPIPEEISAGWQEWWPTGVYVLPIQSRAGAVLGWVLFLQAQPPAPWQQHALGRLVQTWGYCWEMLGGKPKRGLIQRWRASKWQLRVALLFLLALLLLLPVHQTVLAPSEVISLDSQVVAAPIDGVIKTVHVRPNQLVNAGDLLFSLDDTTLRNQLEIMRQSVAVADAEFIAASQNAFHDSTSQSELTLLSGRAHEKRAELEAVQSQLSRVEVKAAKAGLIVFADPDDWLGRPVSTGERIMLLANPEDPGLLIHLPVADAIALEPGAAVKLFLTTRPLVPLEAEVIESSYQATLSPENISSYRLRAQFSAADEGDKAVRVGLQGTAKLYGEKVSLGYYLIRRPLAALREWTGL